MRPGRITAMMVSVVALAVAGWLAYQYFRSMPDNLAIPPHLAESQVAFLEAGLNSHDRNEQAKVLAPPLRGGAWNADAVLPSGARVKIDPSSFTTDGLGGAHVNARVSGSVTAEFVLTLVYADGQWFLVSSVKK